MDKAARGKTLQRGEATAKLMELLLSPFDELIEVNLEADTVRALKHTEGKYFVPLNEFDSEQGGDMTNVMIHPDDRERFLQYIDPATVMERLETSGTPGLLRARFRYRLLDGSYRLVEQVLAGGSLYALPKGMYYSFLYDVETTRAWTPPTASGQQKTANERNTLTGLLWKETFSEAARERMQYGLIDWCIIAIDVEHFRLFNEWYGRKQGDMLLMQIGAALRTVEERLGGLAAYCGQDDFALLIPYDEGSIKRLYEELHALVRKHGTSVGFMPAFGITPLDGSVTIEELYDRATLASHQAKENYHTRICTFDPTSYEQTEKDYQLLSDFQKGLEEHEITFYLQPQCLISTGRVVGAESLVRWRRPDGSMVSPGIFVPVLEEYGFVTELDQYVWEEVCKWQRKWIDAGHKALPISVNVSQIDIFTIDVPDYFAHLLKEYNLPVDVIKVEITESAYAENEKVSDAVKRLRAMGFLVLMDDFGSGYSSLNMLRNLTVDIIKLDAQFLRMSGEDDFRKGVQIVESVVNMAKTMGVPIIVEGVETQEESDFLAGLGCRYAQGFFFHRPMPVEEFEKIIVDPNRIDTRGFRFKAKAQFHTRDFLDDDAFTDTVLNNVLGPVAFYAWHGDDVDVIRYNRQYYEETHRKDDGKHRKAIQNALIKEDVPRLYELLEEAIQRPLDGAEGVLRVVQEDGSVCQFRVRFFFMEEDKSGKMYYGSVEDLTRLITLNDHIRLLSSIYEESILFMRKHRGKWTYQMVIHGLEDYLMLSREDIEQELNGGTFYKRVDGGMQETLQQLAANTEMNVDMAVEDYSVPFHIVDGADRKVMLQAQFYSIHDKASGVEYILLFRKETDGAQ